MRPEELLGLPLEEALRRWAEAGLDAPDIRETADPRGAHEIGTLRIIRATAAEWIVARFWDGAPGENCSSIDSGSSANPTRQKETALCPPKA